MVHIKPMKKFTLILLSLTLTGLVFGFARTGETTTPEEHLSQRAVPITPEQEKEIEAIKEGIRKSYDFQYIVTFTAAREGNPDMCKELNEGGETCEELAKALIVIKNEAEGNCNDVKKEYARNICNAYKTNTCQSLKEAAHRDICTAFLTDNLPLASQALDIIAGRPLDRNEYYMQMGVFFGYKYYRSKLACEKFSKGIKGKGETVCDVFFDTRRPSEIAEQYLNDFAYFYAAKNNNSPDLCEYIQDPKTKTKCLDKKVKTLYQ